MSSHQCPDCTAAVSPVAATAIIRGGSIVLLCRGCFENRHRAKAGKAIEAPEQTGDKSSQHFSQPAAPPASVSAAPDNDEPNEPLEENESSRVSLTNEDVTGEIVLEHKASTEATSTTLLRWNQGYTIGIAIAALALASTFAFTRHRQASSYLALEASAATSKSVHLRHMTFEPPETAVVHDLSVAFSEAQASLQWIHPLAVTRQLPNKNDRRFGADRPGDRPAECLGGHCGVDLGGVRGVTVHAALGGRLFRVKRDANGRSGKYVAIEHPQGMRSYYMHMDRVHPDLIEGMDIASGEPIGTLGSTGVHHSPPHLHFSVQARRQEGGWHYVDPEPMLEQATVLIADGRIPDRAPIAANRVRDPWLFSSRGQPNHSGRRHRSENKNIPSDAELGIVIDHGEISLSDPTGDAEGNDVIVDTGDIIDSGDSLIDAPADSAPDSAPKRHAPREVSIKQGIVHKKVHEKDSKKDKGTEQTNRESPPRSTPKPTTTPHDEKAQREPTDK